MPKYEHIIENLSDQIQQYHVNGQIYSREAMMKEAFVDKLFTHLPDYRHYASERLVSWPIDPFSDLTKHCFSAQYRIHFFFKNVDRRYLLFAVNKHLFYEQKARKKKGMDSTHAM